MATYHGNMTPLGLSSDPNHSSLRERGNSHWPPECLQLIYARSVNCAAL